MTITANVQRQFFGGDLPVVASLETTETRVIRLPSTTPSGSNIVVPKVPTPHRYKGSVWTQDEHERFLLGLEKYPRGPWKLVAQVVATRTTRQTMTHAQKYRQRIARHAKHQEEENDIFAPPQMGTPPLQSSKKTNGQSVIGVAPCKKNIEQRIAEEQLLAQQVEVLAASVSDPPPPELAALEWLLEEYPIEFDDDELAEIPCLVDMMLA